MRTISDIGVQKFGVTMPRRWLLNLSFFVSLSIMNFEAPVFAEESEFAMDDSVKRALDAAKQGRSESAARIGQVFLPRRVCSPTVLLPC